MKSLIVFRSSSCCRFAFVLAVCLFSSCRKPGDAKTAFYYWKSSFSLNAQQAALLKNTAQNVLYLRFFDVVWDVRSGRAVPDALIRFQQAAGVLNITPVIFISNKTMEQVKDTAIDSLAANSNSMVNHIAETNKISYQSIQIDCDWTLSTRDKYFRFLTAFKTLNHRQLQATIRLHQIKYKDRTGVPPVDTGVLMFYNMGKLNAGLQQPNSIYNEADATKYVSYLPQYPLPLDVALPLFSWAVHIRGGRIVQLYGNIGKKQLNDKQNFDEAGNAWRAKKSFFLNGIYIKENDNFKLEQTDINTLKKAARQLSGYLPPQKNRTIIYYELGNINEPEFNAQALMEVSADL